MFFSLRNRIERCSWNRAPIFASNRGSLVVRLTVRPALRGGGTVPLTYLSLKAPVVSMDVTSILGREHHSAEEGEHLEKSCYQQ